MCEPGPANKPLERSGMGANRPTETTGTRRSAPTR